MRYLAVDYGLKQTGIAVCDAEERLASPLIAIQSGKDLAQRLAGIIAEQKAEAVVMGLPLNMDDTEGPQVRLVRAFAEELRHKAGVPVYFQDERLSSFEAEEKLKGVEMTRARKKKRVNAIAAAAILRSFLDSKHSTE